MSSAKLVPDINPRHSRIYQATKSIHEGRVYYVVADTPEQTEDVFCVLVDADVVVGFELARNNSATIPSNVHTWSVAEYDRALSGHAKREFQAALDLAHQDLAALIGAPSSAP